MILNAKLKLIFILFISTIVCNGQTFQPRQYYGAPLEPVDKVLNGAGQIEEQLFVNYCNALTSATRPVIFMDYFYMNNSPQNTINKTEAKMKSIESKFPGIKLIPQYGISMTIDGTPSAHYEQDIAYTTKYDANIQAMCTALKAAGRPCYLRIGYEFNGWWNGYVDKSYKDAFIKITKALRCNGVNAVTVWCAYPATTSLAYYPGDEWVDWWGVDIFSASDITSSSTSAFITNAGRHNKPVMIGECTPRYVGVTDGQKDWDQWFKPFFQLIHDKKEIKAFSYINLDWSTTRAWSSWGDARIEANAVVSANFLEEMKLNLYQHSVFTPPAFKAAQQPLNTIAGITAKYFEGTWTTIPNFDAMKPIKENIISTINISTKIKSDNFGFQYKGFIKVPKDGVYSFFANSKDGSRIYIGNTLVVDNDGKHVAVEKSGNIALKAGMHAIKVEYFESTGTEFFNVSYQGPCINKQPIPASILFTYNTLVTGMGEEEQGSLNSYSNPVNGDFHFKMFSAESDEILVSVFGANGDLRVNEKIDLSAGENWKNLNLSTLSSGVYFVQFYSTKKNQSESVKIVVVNN